MIYDISFPLSPETMVYPGDPPFLREVLLDGAKGDDCTLSLLHLGSHLGTHIDFPRHFFPHGMDAASFPLEQLCGACKVFYLPDAAEITKDMLEPLDIHPGDRVLFRTDNEAFDGIHPLPHPVYLTAEAGEYLAEQKISLLGVDYESPEGDGNFPIHKALLGRNIPILENLKLKEVPAGTYRLYCLPLKITEGDGCWVRPCLLYTSDAADE